MDLASGFGLLGRVSDPEIPGDRTTGQQLSFGYDTNGKGAAVENAQQATVTMRLAGEERTFDLAPEDSLLEGALGLREDAPYSCMGGACGTCRAKLIEGTVEMDHNFALGQDDLDAGYILTCQSHATSPKVAIDYDG